MLASQRWLRCASCSSCATASVRAPQLLGAAHRVPSMVVQQRRALCAGRAGRIHAVINQSGEQCWKWLLHGALRRCKLRIFRPDPKSHKSEGFPAALIFKTHKSQNTYCRSAHFSKAVKIVGAQNPSGTLCWRCRLRQQVHRWCGCLQPTPLTYGHI